jgi:hypothetical protein
MRSGYSDDLDQRDLAMYRGRVASAMRGERGQMLLRDALAALDAMPVKRLVRDELQTPDGDVCLLGACGRLRGFDDLDMIDPDDHDVLAKRFNVSRCLIAEIEFVNDDDFGYRTETPEQRFERVRKWLVENIR